MARERQRRVISKLRSKMGCLPAKLRMEAARRYRDGASGKTILAWLNSQQIVAKVIARECQPNASRLLSAENFSEWLRSEPPEFTSPSSDPLAVKPLKC